ncbi:MAG: hypothetical protein ACRCWF_04685 [Beijerinckiaceae bacterium]
MAILRIAAAAGLLLAVAPEQTMEAARSMFGMASAVKEQHMPTAESAMAYCRKNPTVCAEAARTAVTLTESDSQPRKPSRP